MTEEQRSEQPLIIGLGNPGSQYRFTRHNAGFLMAEYLAERFNVKFKKCSFTKGIETQAVHEGQKFRVLLPVTYMNNSGIAVQQAIEYYSLSLDDIIVVCDDVNLDFGQLRMRSNGGHGGNNGLRSIIQHLDSRDFVRLRMGVSSPPPRWDLADYVLSSFTAEERKDLESFVAKATECCLHWMTQGIGSAMDTYNRREDSHER